MVDLVPWTLFFDGSSCGNDSGIGVVLISPRRGQILSSHFRLKPLQPIIKLSIMLFSREIKADAVEIFGDYMLVINQLVGEYEYKDDIL